MTARQLLEIKPGITIGNVMAFSMYIITLVIFVAVMRADIDAQKEMLTRTTEALHDHMEAAQRVNDKQIELNARLSNAESSVAKNALLAERLKGIETSLQYISSSITELKDQASKNFNNRNSTAQ